MSDGQCCRQTAKERETDVINKLASPGPRPPAFQKPSDAALKNRYTYHAPKGDQTQRYEKIRHECLALALKIRDLTPCSPEQTRALNSLDEVMFLANAAIARNE